MTALRPLLALPLLAAGIVGQRAEQQSPGHWSYAPIERPSAPAAEADDWSLSDLDRLVLARMREHDLEPSPTADRATWLRRVALDLTGLPPTVADLDAFVADDAPGARERVVDRLLDSDAYAERWTSWWLDLARYADSQGYEKDGLRPTMWRYRDWVLRAFREHMPFDRFTIEQLAGDLLPDATVEQRLATAFHRQTMSNTEGGTDDEEFRVAAVVDRVDTTMQVWMGSTLGCAQCHDHKYDPFSQREFFELFAFFDQTEDADRDDDAPTMFAPTAAQRAEHDRVQAELAQVREQLAALDRAELAQSTWRLLGPIAGDDFATVRDRAFAPERDGVRVDEQQEGRPWQEQPGFTDGEVHPLRGANSAFYLFRTVDAPRAGEAVLSLGCDDALAVWWNGEQVLRENVAGAAAPDEHRVAVTLRQGANTVLLKVTNGGGPGGFCYELWSGGEGELRVQERALAQQLEQSRGPRVPVMVELPEDRRRTTRVHIRGSFLDQGEAVRPDTPRVWPPLQHDAPRDRLGFARWLVARDNPLTARVLANRIWSELFGRGIVPTLEDFGSQGDPPSHPRLLDWLACEFVDSGWSLPQLLKAIVLSRTYAQDASTTARQRERDPDNVWLSRGPSFRLSAEQLRDQALFVAGMLTGSLGGPSVMPPQPDGIWRQPYSGATWNDATGPDRYRRALYTFWRRTSPHPMMLVFDAQSREACVLRRQRSNTPLQALVLWNDPQFTEPALVLADFARSIDAADDERIVRLWRRCLLRTPRDVEVARLRKLLDTERELGAADRDAWVVVAGVILCLDEFVTRR